jgi:mannose-6-phosphate isomerase-like protein (cupin superfamily)
MELQIERFDRPHETKGFPLGTFELLSLGGMRLGRARYEPGWVWSEHVGAATGATSCEVEHVGIVLSGRAAVRMDDGHEFVMEPGDVFAIPGGHDSWVVGDRPYVSLHLLGADTYASEARAEQADA